MRHSRARVEATKSEEERRLRYRGAACISLDALQFCEDDVRTLDAKNVERLVDVFRREGCQRQPIRNHVLGLITESCLDIALETSRISASSLLTPRSDNYPHLRLPSDTRLVCLHSKHRIQAGREFLPARDKWWIVDLYLEDVSQTARQDLIEEYSNEKIPSDGEAYCKIRQYHFQRNFRLEARWWTRLRGCRERNLKALLKHAEITAALDALLDVPGLWAGMQLSTIHKILALNSDDEILNHLEHIRRFWHDLMDGDFTAMHKVDEGTVKFLELRAPGASTSDAEEIQQQLEWGKVFGTFSGEDRACLFHRLSQYHSLIPSLNTFFRNFTYWEACVQSVKHLITLTRRETVMSAFERCYTGANQHDDRVLIQVDESNFAVTSGDSNDQIELGYRQIMAFAMRHLLEIPRRASDDYATVRPRLKASKALLYQFARLAFRLGFESPEIHALLIDEDDSEAPATSTSNGPLMVTSGSGVKLRRRCGLPLLDTFRNDCEFLFLHHLHDVQTDRGEGITSYFVLKATYFAFLGQSKGEIDLSPRGLRALDSTDIGNFSPAEVMEEEGQAQDDWWEQDMEQAALVQAARQAYDQPRLNQAAREDAIQQAYDQAANDQLARDEAEREAEVTLEEAAREQAA